MIDKKIILILTDDVILTTKTIFHYKSLVNKNFELISCVNKNPMTEFNKKIDLIIVDSILLLKVHEGSSFAQLLLERNIFIPIIVLESEKSISLPEALDIFGVVSYPVQPKKLWAIIDEIIENKFI